MTRKDFPHPMARSASPAGARDEPDEPDELDEVAEAPPIVERPDGYYWQAPDGQADIGPFARYELAVADRDGVSDEPADESLREAESNIGINEWIDAETGAPAEGQSPPHLEEE